jgi:large subunit ribosomal protein L21
MYAIVKAGGHQYRVAEGDVIEVERLGAGEGDSVELEDVLLVGGDEVHVGTPFVEGAVVKATVLGESKGKKIEVLKYKSKNRYRKKTGHRQRYTKLQIDAITV